MPILDCLKFWSFLEKVIGDRVIIEVETNNVSGCGNKIANTFETDQSCDNRFEIRNGQKRPDPFLQLQE